MNHIRPTLGELQIGEATTPRIDRVIGEIKRRAGRRGRSFVEDGTGPGPDLAPVTVVNLVELARDHEIVRRAGGVRRTTTRVH